MILLQWVFDGVLGCTLIWLAWRTLASEDLFKAVVLFIAFGLLMALAWVRLEAPDIALAEAAIGAGLTGALLLAALARLKVASEPNPAPAEAARQTELKIKPGLSNRHAGDLKQRQLWRVLLALLLLVSTAGLAYAVLSLPAVAPGLSTSVAKNLAVSGTSNPVTAVLLNFRGYDTLLEMAVLWLALLGVWSLGIMPVQAASSPGPVLVMLAGVLVPMLVLVAAYLLWLGSHAPGGAFQAGSMLAAAGVLLLLAGWTLPAAFSGGLLRFSLVIGLAGFVLAAVVMLLIGRRLLEYPLPLSGTIILLIEALATLSIGFTLTALFAGGRPASAQSAASEEETGCRR